MSNDFIPVYQPALHGREREYVMACLDSTWISSKGEFIARFERDFAEFTGSRFAATVANGTVAIHLALAALGIGPGDEVIVPTLTYIASVNPIVQVGAKPIFVDSLRDSWQLDPDDVRRKLTSRTRAIMAVHLYGLPADVDVLADIAREHDIFLIEDCAEAFGSRIDGTHVGTFGDVATFSFFGNKTVTTGEGGMVITQDPALDERLRHLKGQGLAKHRTYWHDVLGYNYRMTNIQAAIGVAQMERATDLIAAKQRLARKYDEALEGLPLERHCSTRAEAEHTYWMYSVLVPDDGRRDEIMRELADAGIETRPVFYPVHLMPMYAHRYGRFDVAQEVARRGINLPSWPDMTDAMVGRVAGALARALGRTR